MLKLDKSTTLPPEYSDLLNKLEMHDREKIEYLVRRALNIPSRLYITDLWEQPELAITNWILLMTGINQNEEVEIAKTLLVWKAFFAKDSAAVLCIQSSEHQYFRCCSSHFGTVNCPTLMMSNTPQMKHFIKIESELLYKLNREDGGLQRFLTRVHSSIENGLTLQNIEKDLRSEKFWSGLKMVYEEIKELTKIGFNTSSI